MTEAQMEARRRENRRQGRPAFDPPRFYEGAAADRGRTGAMEAVINPPNTEEVVEWLRDHSARLGRPVAVRLLGLGGPAAALSLRVNGSVGGWYADPVEFGGWATGLKDRFNQVAGPAGLELTALEPDDEPSLVLVLYRVEDRALVERLFRPQDWLRRGRESLLAGNPEAAIRALRRAARGGLPPLEWGPPLARAYKAAGREADARRLTRSLLELKRRGA
ncbi:MAG TPA: hypothetical protein VIO14_12100 [Dehalococcoidia bacterium]